MNSQIFSPHGLESFLGKLEIISYVTSLRQYDECDVTIYVGLVSDTLVDRVFI